MAQKKITFTLETQLAKTMEQIAKLKKDEMDTIFTQAAQQYVLANSCLLAEEIERLHLTMREPAAGSTETPVRPLQIQKP